MNSVFIVRPFGNKRPVIKKNKEGVPEIIFFDFDKVENELIIPAMEKADLQGGTTQRIFEAGEIKEDMFSQLLLADIVIADITIHNANVFYELGIRHSLRKKTTVLIKCDGFDDTPFDIIGYKYLSYQKEDPGAVMDDLTKFLIDSQDSAKYDSPVFNMLPKLREQETESFLAVPADFTNEVTIAAAARQLGKLSLLAKEADFFAWKIPALRMIGEELFKLKAFGAGREIWETIKSGKPKDIQANDRLATIYQRLADTEMKNNPSEGLALLSRSDIAVQNLLDNYESLDINKRAEVYALKGRNAKTKWINAWKNSAGEQMGVEALQSISLETAYKNYESGYYENLNHFYSGINALGLLITMISLAEQHGDAWTAGFKTDEDANQQLKTLKEKQQQLAVSIEFSLYAERKRLETQGKSDIWLDITEADFNCLTATKPPRVAVLYKQVLENAPDFAIEAVINQLKIYEQLKVLPENVQAALTAIRSVEERTAEAPKHYLLFTGHMIDKPGRPARRFPEEKETTVREKIRTVVAEEKNKIEGSLTGICGGACGGDILFHEVCEELGIKTGLYLALPAEKFKTASVSFAGPVWVERFDNLYKKLPHSTLSDTEALPKWLQKVKGYSIWERNNLWELNSALINGGMNMTLIALWDGKGGDGPGGTADMVKAATDRGAKVILLDITKM